MNPLSDIIRDLRLFPCLSSLKAEEIAIFGEMARMKKIGKNCNLFVETEPVDFFFILKSGSVKLYKTSRGRELIVKIMGPGDYFCCAPVCTSGQYLVGAIALEESALIAIPSENFKKRLMTGVGDMGWRMIIGLCNKIRYLSNLVEDLTFKDVEQRIIVTLLRLAEEKSPGKKIVSFRLTHQDIASMTGTVREVVSRTMSSLKKRGVIVDSNVRGFKIDKEGLLSLLNQEDPLL